MTIRFLYLGVALFALTCIYSGASAASADRQFEWANQRFTKRFLATRPEAATQLGDHRFDRRVRDLSASGIARELALFRATLVKLDGISRAKLSTAHSIDYRILHNQLEAEVFSIDVLKEYQWDVLSYNPAQGIYLLLARDFAPLPQRLASVKARLQAMPGNLAAARKNLVNPPRIQTETAILQNKGAIALLGDELETFLKDAPAMRRVLAPARARAVAALKAYGEWLEKDLLPRSHGEFRLGAEKYRQKLRYALESDIAPEKILRLAEADLAKTQASMFDTALPLYRKYFPDKSDSGNRKAVIKAVLDRLADDRPDNATVVDLAKADLAAATAFVRERQLMTVPNDPLNVIVMPEFQRGVAVAYCDPPGPLEKNGATFFAISPTPADWDAERVASFYREDNRSMLKNLTVHEAMPGHYLQFVFANRSKAPTHVRALFYSGTFAEGWAVYTEQLMADAGFGGPEVKMQQLKMRLRSLINAIIDQKIHAGAMTEK
jgi:uncharacterized protein (DUF885 family)